MRSSRKRLSSRSIYKRSHLCLVLSPQNKPLTSFQFHNRQIRILYVRTSHIVFRVSNLILISYFWHIQIIDSIDQYFRSLCVCLCVCRWVKLHTLHALWCYCICKLNLRNSFILPLFIYELRLADLLQIVRWQLWKFKLYQRRW